MYIKVTKMNATIATNLPFIHDNNKKKTLRFTFITKTSAHVSQEKP